MEPLSVVRTPVCWTLCKHRPDSPSLYIRPQVRAMKESWKNGGQIHLLVSPRNTEEFLPFSMGFDSGCSSECGAHWSTPGTPHTQPRLLTKFLILSSHTSLSVAKRIIYVPRPNLLENYYTYFQKHTSVSVTYYNVKSKERYPQNIKSRL